MSSRSLPFLASAALLLSLLSPASASGVYDPQKYDDDHNCTVTHETHKADLCVPDLGEVTGSDPSVLATRITTEQQEKCVTTESTSCKAHSIFENVKICKYAYEKKEVKTTGRSFKVVYVKKCDVKYVTVCKRNSYSHKDNCKELPQETCFNKPQAGSKLAQISLTIPVPVLKCQTRKVEMADITCQTSKEERCFNLPVLKIDNLGPEEFKRLEILPQAVCTTKNVRLPAKVCSTVLDEVPQDYTKGEHQA